MCWMFPWEFIYHVKVAVNKAIEEKRNSDGLGSSLAAEVKLYCSDDIANRLLRLPMFLDIRRSQMYKITNAIEEFFAVSLQEEILISQPEVA